VKVSHKYLFPSKPQVCWLHLQVVFVHLWGESFSPLGNAQWQCPFKPWLE